jgi:hypothetical protein
MLFLVMAMGFMLFCFTLTAESEETSPLDVLMIMPTGLVSNSLIAEYEHIFGNHFGLGIRGTATSHWLWEGGQTGTGDDYDWIYTLSGIGFGLSARIYPWGQAPQGYYLGPRLDYLSYSGTYENRAQNEDPVNVTLQVTTIHIETGYKFIFGRHFVLSPFVDAGIPLVKSSDSGATLAGIFTFILGGGIYLGWAF